MRKLAVVAVNPSMFKAEAEELFPSELTDPFALLGVPRSFNLEATVLEEAFLQKQLGCHPDQFTDAAEKARAEEAFGQIVAAHDVLKLPHKRAVCLMKLCGLWPPPQDPSVLEEAMEAQETLLEGKLEVTKLQESVSEALMNLEIAFQDEAWERVPTLYLRWNYLARLLERYLEGGM